MSLNKFLELIGSILAVVGMFLIAYSFPSGWAISLAANVAMLIMLVRVRMGYMVIMNLFFLAANIIGTYKNCF